MAIDFGRMDIEPVKADDRVAPAAEAVQNLTQKAPEAQKNGDIWGFEQFGVEGWQDERTLMISCGNGGGNMLKHNIEQNTCGNVEYFITDTDYIALKTKAVDGANVILFGEKECRGKGAGTHPEIAERAAEESVDKIRLMVKDAGLVFIIAGEGGGTGTGCSPIVAQIAKEAGAIVVAIVTKPFRFEGKAVMNRALEGINKLRKNVNAILVVDNQKVLSIGEANIPWMTRLRKIDDFVGGILSGFINVTRDNSKMKLDFNDIKLMFQNCEGSMFIGAGEAEYTPLSVDSKDWDGGRKAMMAAVENAISSPLVDGIDLKNARGVIALYLMGEDVGMEAIEEAQDRVMEAIGNDDANIIVGADSSPSMNGKIKVFFILAGLSEDAHEEKVPVMAAPQIRPLVPEIGERISMFTATSQAMQGEGRAVGDVIVKAGIPEGIFAETNVFKGKVSDFYGETQKIAPISETPRSEKSVEPKESNTFAGFARATPTETSAERQHTPSIHGFEPPPGFLRTQCQ